MAVPELISKERFEIARVELDLLVAEWLKEYVAKTVVVEEPPMWTWTSEWSIHYRRLEKTIYLPEFFIKAFILSPSKTKRALRWSLAHEFWHYVQHVRGGPLGIPILDFPRLAEYISEKRAVLLSGITDAEGWSLTTDITDLVMFFEKEEMKSGTLRHWINY